MQYQKRTHDRKGNVSLGVFAVAQVEMASWDADRIAAPVVQQLYPHGSSRSTQREPEPAHAPFPIYAYCECQAASRRQFHGGAFQFAMTILQGSILDRLVREVHPIILLAAEVCSDVTAEQAWVNTLRRHRGFVGVLSFE